jgi:hypothetical protein
MQLVERNATVAAELVKRLRSELRSAGEEARVAGDERRVAELWRAQLAVMAADGALAGKLKSGRRSSSGAPVYTVEEMTAMLFDACALGFAALAD